MCSVLTCIKFLRSIIAGVSETPTNRLTVIITNVKHLKIHILIALPYGRIKMTIHLVTKKKLSKKQ